MSAVVLPAASAVFTSAQVIFSNSMSGSEPLLPIAGGATAPAQIRIIASFEAVDRWGMLRVHVCLRERCRTAGCSSRSDTTSGQGQEKARWPGRGPQDLQHCGYLPAQRCGIAPRRPATANE